MKRKKKPSKLSKLRLHTIDLLARLWADKVTLALVYLIVRVEGLHTKFDTVSVALADLGMTIYVNLIQYQARLESALYSVLSLFGGEPS